MASGISLDRLRFIVDRMRSRLWMKPLVVCVLSVIGAFVAGLADGTSATRRCEALPSITGGWP